MRIARWLSLARRLSRAGDLSRRICIGVIALGERLLAPTLVDVAAVAGVGRALAVGALLSAVFALRSVIESAHVARTEGNLYARVVGSVLRQDALHPSVLPDEDARATIFEGGHAVALLLAVGLPHLCANLVAAGIFAAFVAFAEPARVVWVGAIAGGAGTLVFIASRRVVESAQRAESASWIALADGVGDAFDGRLEIVAGGRADAHVAAFARVASSWSEATLRSVRAARFAGRLPLLALATCVAAAVTVDALLRGDPTGRTFVEAALLGSMAPAFVGVAQGLHDLVRTGRRLQPLLDLVRGALSSPRAEEVAAAVAHRVELRDVHFAYEANGRRHEALRGVSFVWRRGELLALAGPNGSGKSTCLRALLGLGKTTSGDVLVDGAPLERLESTAWRRSIAFLPQRPYLPPRVTVRDCLRFVDAEVTEATMIRAIERSGLTRILKDVRSPLEARVDELSVGQRQRVGLARVLCRTASMVLLDEPDANLDDDGVRAVTELVRELARDNMVLVAAHSPALLAAADRVVKLEAGRISAESTQRCALA
jgi:ABC-type transport system involved in cytochrome bd biosynthesis fused ATPase/permease subunit